MGAGADRKGILIASGKVPGCCSHGIVWTLSFESRHTFLTAGWFHFPPNKFV